MYVNCCSVLVIIIVNIVINARITDDQSIKFPSETLEQMKQKNLHTTTEYTQAFIRVSYE